ncbi:MAG: hypothetical protein JO307_19345 [Bryobacterales bacterium]|nr:hypothetical protein [Bryobacterales bacterium]
MDAQRFAELWAGADAGNGNEAEAVGKFRLLRRMALAENRRVIDCLTGHEDTVKALDAQIGPLRPGEDEITKLQAALSQREQEAVRLADSLTQARRELAQAQQELSQVRQRPAYQAAGVSSFSALDCDGWISGRLLQFLVFVAVLLMIAASCGVRF